MSPLSRLAAGLIALACLAPAAHATDSQVMHRFNVCVKTADGWCTAESTEGGFTVTLPAAFADYTNFRSAEVDRNGEVADFERGDVIATQTADDMVFIVTRISYRGGAASARKHFEAVVQDDSASSAAASSRRGKVAGHDVFETVVDSREGRRHTRQWLLDDDVIVMVGIMTPAQEAEHPGMMDQFLGSLFINRP